MNNKGVTLIELLIVIVVIGIISAFAIPAVGNFLDSARQQAVYQDAVAVRNAASWYCSQPENTCAVDEELTITELGTYLEGFDSSLYEMDDTGTDDYVLATLSSGDWLITLESVGDADDANYEWNNSQADPINADSGDVNVDAD